MFGVLVRSEPELGVGGDGVRAETGTTAMTGAGRRQSLVTSRRGSSKAISLRNVRCK